MKILCIAVEESLTFGSNPKTYFAITFNSADSTEINKDHIHSTMKIITTKPLFKPGDNIELTFTLIPENASVGA